MHAVGTGGLKIEESKETLKINQEVYEFLSLPLCHNELFYQNKQISWHDSSSPPIKFTDS